MKCLAEVGAVELHIGGRICELRTGCEAQLSGVKADDGLRCEPGVL